MATQAQEQSFLTTYSPLASQAGAALGVAPTTILAQWANESAWGTSSAAAANNLGGIMSGGQTASYATPQAFEQAYVSTIAGNFPGATNTGDNVGAFVGGLIANGKGQSYIGTDSATSYASSLTSLASQIGTMLTGQTSSNGTSTPVVSNTTNATGSSSGSTTSTSPASVSNASTCASGALGIGGFFSWGCWQNVAGDVAFVMIGVFILVIAVASGLFGEGARKQLVMVTKKSVT